MKDFFNKKSGKAVVEFGKKNLTSDQMLILIRITNGDLLEDKIIQIIPEFKYDDKDTKIDYDFQK